MLFGLAACGKGGKDAQTADAEANAGSDTAAAQAQQAGPGWKSSFMTLSTIWSMDCR